MSQPWQWVANILTRISQVKGHPVQQDILPCSTFLLLCPSKLPHSQTNDYLNKTFNPIFGVKILTVGWNNFNSLHYCLMWCVTIWGKLLHLFQDKATRRLNWTSEESEPSGTFFLMFTKIKLNDFCLKSPSRDRYCFIPSYIWTMGKTSQELERVGKVCCVCVVGGWGVVHVSQSSPFHSYPKSDDPGCVLAIQLFMAAPTPGTACFSAVLLQTSHITTLRMTWTMVDYQFYVVITSSNYFQWNFGGHTQTTRHIKPKQAAVNHHNSVPKHTPIELLFHSPL